MGYLTTGEVARSLGVGLNTVKRWIGNGNLRGVRTPGGHWRIPIKHLHEFMESHDMVIPEREKGPCRVLIVDDDPAVGVLLSALLEQTSFRCETQCVYDGYTGLLRIGAWHPQILILDILIPGIDGLEVLRRIKTDVEFAEMAIIAVTAAFDEPRIVQALREANVYALIPKPVDSNRFLHCIESCREPVGSPSTESLVKVRNEHV